MKYIILVLFLFYNVLSENVSTKIPLNSDSLIMSLWELETIKHSCKKSSAEFKNAKKYKFKDFFKYPFKNIIDSIVKNTISAKRTLTFTGNYISKNTFFVGAGCNNDSLYLFKFENIQVILNDVTDYLLITNPIEIPFLNFSANISKDSLLNRYLGPYKQNQNIIAYLCENVAEAKQNEGGETFFSPLLHFYFKDNKIYKIFIVFPGSC